MLYLKLSSEPRKAVERLGHGLEELMGWMRLNSWRLKPKMEVLLVGPHLPLESRYTSTLDTLPLKDHVHSLGVLLDLALLQDKVAAVPGTAFYQFCLTHQLQTFWEKMETLPPLHTLKLHPGSTTVTCFYASLPL